MKIEFDVDSNDALLLIAFYDLIAHDFDTNTADCWEWLIDELMLVGPDMVKRLERDGMDAKRSKYLSEFHVHGIFAKI